MLLGATLSPALLGVLLARTRLLILYRIFLKQILVFLRETAATLLALLRSTPVSAPRRLYRRLRLSLISSKIRKDPFSPILLYLLAHLRRTVLV